TPQGVDAGIKRQHFRRSCSQRKQPTARTQYRTLYETLNSPWLKPAAGDTIRRAPTVPAPVDGMIVGCRAPYADRDTLVVHQLRTLGTAWLIKVRCGLTTQSVPDHAR